MTDKDLVAEERAAACYGTAGRDHDRRSGMDAGTRRLALIAGGLGALLVATVGGWSLLGHRPAGVPLLAPPPGPVRVRPTDPGGMQLMTGQVAQTNGTAAQALAPGPEAAAPQALQAEVDAARKADAPPAPAVVPKVAEAIPRSPSPAPASPPDMPSSRPSIDAAPAGAPSSPDAVAPDASTAAPAIASPDASAIPDTAPAAPPATQPSAAAAGGHAVQLAALDTELAASAEWSRLARQAPALFADRVPAILHVSRGGRQFFRLRTGGFASVADATAFCGRLRASGIACTLADF